MSQITHKNVDGRMVQIVSPQRLRDILDQDGSDYSRPDDFGPDDQWNVEGADNETVASYQDRLASIVAAITPHLREDLDPQTYAAGMLEEAEDDDQSHFEVRSSHTRRNNPYTFSI